MEELKIGITNFARSRHRPSNGFSYFTGKINAYGAGLEFDLINIIKHNWDKRKPGDGRTDLLEVVKVPVAPYLFRSATVLIHENIELKARFYRRQTFEEPSIKVSSLSQEYSVPKFVEIILYNASILEPPDLVGIENCEWAVVSINASDVENEPMHPLTMARNMLGKAGGTKCEYTAQQFAEAVYYWSTRVSIEPVV